MIRRLSEEGPRREGFFEAAEFQAVLSHLPEYLKGFARFGYLSGWRKNEIRSLEWSSVDMLGRVIRLQTKKSKTKKGRTLPLAGELWTLIERQWKMREYENADATTGISSYVFHSDGAPIGDTRKAWATACVAAQVGVMVCKKCEQSMTHRKCPKCKVETSYHGKIFHDLRRTRARDMRRAGVPEDVCMMVLGHRTRSIFTRYDIVDERDQQEALLKTQEYLQAAQNQQEQRQTVVPIQQEAAGRVS